MMTVPHWSTTFGNVMRVLSLIALRTHAFPLIEGSVPVPSSLGLSPSCGFAGRAENLGIGIRVGSYCVISALWAAGQFFPKHLFKLQCVVLAFLVGLLIVTSKIAIYATWGYSAEVFIGLQLLTWTSLTIVRSNSTFSLSNHLEGILWTTAMDILHVAVLALNIWFWFPAFDSLKHDQCETTVFFFTKVGMGGWFRVLMKAATILGLLNHTYTFWWRGIALWSRETIDGDDIQNAVQVFEHYQALQREFETESEKISAFNKRSGEISMKETESVNSSSWRTVSIHTDDESIETKVERIQNQDSSATCTDTNPSVPSNEIAGPKNPSRHFHSPLFENIYSGEFYLNHCIHTGTANRLRAHCSRPHKSISKFQVISSAVKKAEDFQARSPGCSSYVTCLADYFGALLTFRFTRPTAILLNHLKRSCILSCVSSPYQIQTSLKYEAFQPPSRAIALASHIQISQRTRMARQFRWSQGCFDVIVHVFLALQIELTLFWNGAAGIYDMGSVGQLIPLMIGFGSLLLVIVNGFEKLRCKESTCQSGNEYTIVKQGWEMRLTAAYEEWKKHTGK